MHKVLAATLFAIAIFGGQGATALGFMDSIPAAAILPPPPPHGSATEQGEIAEILNSQNAASPAALAQAKRDNDTEDASIFVSVLGPGWDLSKLPKTKFLVDRMMEIDRRESGAAKRFFHRARPWITDPEIQTCATHGNGPARDSYPSGHTMLGFEIGEVLASLMPNHAQAILARASQYGENRILCGFHYRSDVTAGEQFGTALAIQMMQDPGFQVWLDDAQLELQRAGFARPPLCEALCR